MTTSTISENANSSSPSSSKSNDEVVVEMLAEKARPVVHQDSSIASAVRENSIADLTTRIIDMSSAIRSSPTAPAHEDIRMFSSGQQQTITHEISAKTSDQWMMTNGHVTNAGAIHRKSFNIDALLAKSQTEGQQKERFVNSPDSANDCTEDRRDFTPSPEGHNFRYV